MIGYNFIYNELGLCFSAQIFTGVMWYNYYLLSYIRMHWLNAPALL